MFMVLSVIVIHALIKNIVFFKKTVFVDYPKSDNDKIILIMRSVKGLRSI